MRKSVLVALGGLAFAAIAGTSYLLGMARAEDSGAGAAGSWQGRTTHRFFPLEPGQRGDSGVSETTLDLTQTGSDVAGTLTVATDEGPQVFTVAGRAGSRAFWLVHQDAASPLLLSGHLKGKAPRLRMTGTGVVAQADGASEFRFSLKRTVP